MRAFKIAFVIAGLTAGSAFASDFSFTGNFENNNEVQPFFFSVTKPVASVTLQTLSSDGGTNAAGTVIPADGFDPIITLFDAISGRVIAYNDDGSLSGFDSLLQRDLGAGDYVATVTQYDNSFVGPSLSDGFQGTSFAGLDFHEPHWALDILNASSASVEVPYISPIPEPETYAMLLAGLALLGWRMRSAES